MSRDHDSAEDLGALLAALARAEARVDGQDEEAKGVARDYGRAIEALHAAGLRRLIAALKVDPVAAARLKEAASDEIVYAILRRHGIVKPSLNERIEAALNSIRPQLAAHGGDVSLVRLLPPSVDLRFSGACDGCSASQLTFQAGVRKAIRDACPEITNIRQVKGDAASGAAFESPFARDARWMPACRLDEIPDGGLRALSLSGEKIILWRNGGTVACYADSCAHLGYPLADGIVSDTVLTCARHGFAFDLSDGACLTAPDLRLQRHDVRLADGRIEVSLS